MMELFIMARELLLDFVIRRVRCAFFSIALAACLFRVEMKCNEGARKHFGVYFLLTCVFLRIENLYSINFSSRL